MIYRAETAQKLSTHKKEGYLPSIVDEGMSDYRFNMPLKLIRVALVVRSVDVLQLCTNKVTGS